MTEKEEEKMPAGASEELGKVARLLDPHLSDTADIKRRRSPDRWPVLKALVFIFGTSLLIWALVIALIYYLL